MNEVKNEMTVEQKKAAFAAKYSLKAGAGRPVSFEKNTFIVGEIVTLGVEMVKGNLVDFLTFKEVETNIQKSMWIDKGLNTELQRAGIIGHSDQGLVLKSKGIISIEHLGMASLDNGKTVNQYEVMVSAQ